MGLFVLPQVVTKQRERVEEGVEEGRRAGHRRCRWGLLQGIYNPRQVTKEVAKWDERVREARTKAMKVSSLEVLPPLLHRQPLPPQAHMEYSLSVEAANASLALYFRSAPS